jgi:hypothetical protein
MKICPNCRDANAHEDYEGPTCEMCHGVGTIITDDTIRAACNAYGASLGQTEWEWMKDALAAAATTRS